MAEEIFASVQVRRDNKANWEAVNPILLDGEAAYEKDTDMFKIGDGVNNYKNLPYHNKVGPKGDTGATPQISMSVSTGAAGSEASVSVSGTAENPLISLTIPRGDTGASGVTQETDPTVPAWAKQPSKPTYMASEVGARPDTWMPSASDVGADAAGTAAAQVVAHNVSGEAHADLRALIEGLTSRLNALADSDDTTLDQLSEIVAYIKSNKALIDAVTTGKVSTSDIVDNLTTNASGKVLSAAQGVRLKALIDAIVIPDKLPNPQPLTINGQSYDGSAKVEVTVTGEGGGANINDTTPSANTTYSSQKIEAVVSELNQANATQDTEIAKKANDADLAAVAKSGSYNDLSDKPTIPTVPSALPNPNKLILSGAVTAEYDGSAEVNVEIPAGGSGSYTLPVASPTTLGGVMPAAKTDEMTQAVGVDEAGGLWTAEGGGDNKNIEGTISTIAGGTIPAGTAGRTIIDTGVTFGDMLKHKLVSVYLKTTAKCTYLVTFHWNPTMYYHGVYITSGEATAGYIALENCGKTMRAVSSRSGVYSTVPSGFSRNNNFVTGNNADVHNFINYLKPIESEKLKIIPWIDVEETTPVDAAWSVTAID